MTEKKKFNAKNILIDVGLILILAIILIIRTNNCTTIEVNQDPMTKGYCSNSPEGCLVWIEEEEGYQWINNPIQKNEEKEQKYSNYTLKELLED